MNLVPKFIFLMLSYARGLLVKRKNHVYVAWGLPRDSLRAQHTSHHGTSSFLLTLLSPTFLV